MRTGQILLAFIFLAILPSAAFAHQYPAGFKGFADSASCAPCHKAIYDEWSASMHSKSSRASDPAHNAVFSAFSQSMAKTGKKAPYFCASCHNPASEGAAKTYSSMPGIPCTFCHSEEGITDGKMFNTYKIATTITSSSASSAQEAPHEVSQWSFAQPYMMCMGCHGKMVNGKGTVICSADLEGYSDCVKCHMEEKAGPPAEGSAKSSHYSHFFPGGHDKDMLQKGISLSLGAEMGKLIVIIKNDNPHFFPSTNPMRAAYLKVEVLDKEGNPLFENPAPAPGQKEMFMRVFSADGKVGVPTWEAKEALDSRINSHEERTLTYDLPKGAAMAKAAVYYRLVTPAAAAKLGIPAKSAEPVKVSEAEIEIK
ncbi:MAG: multiheme c-type cytochrome [Nitrospirota bacterium]